jgi:ATP/maltotriose-dependent transcriptional regulator MalT
VREIPESVVRFGRVETVLVENDDPESAIEFAQELVGSGGDTAQLQLLMGACTMRLARPAEALTHFERVRSMTESDPVMQLHALYNIARARHAAGQLAEAAAAYDQYVAFAQAHSDLSAFVAEASRVATTLRGRAGAAAPAARRR